MAKFSRVLIANRGEIAARIARSVKSAGLEAVALYSTADRSARHVKSCDLAVELQGASAGDTYLNIDKVLAAAIASGAEAIHPGYGFLSENAEFAARCKAAGLVFIGPSAEAIELMGSKRAAKAVVSSAGVTCIAGYDGAEQSDDALIREAKLIGFPVMVKASAGGGGRGMRLVTGEAELADAISSARSEALSAFGDGELILEQAITTGRHIEIQIIADQHGNIVHLGERDCSLQRRHQKVIEEAPSPFVDEALREAMGTAAVNAAKACDYEGVGTVEFLVAEDRSFSFLEMNTRLQVEHPVTELVTGVDLVDLQLSIAQGDPLPIVQDDVAINGHSIEARIYAEDPYAGFLPQTGSVYRWEVPEGAGIRVDAGIEEGSDVSPYYDPMLAKLIAHGATRELARERLQSTLRRTTLLGVTSNQLFLHDLLADQKFVEGNASITYLDQNPYLYARPVLSPEAIALAAAATVVAGSPQPLHFLNWSNAEPMRRCKTLAINGQECVVSVLADGLKILVGLSEETDEGKDDESIELCLEERTSQDLTLTMNGVRHKVPWCSRGNEMFLQWGASQLHCVDNSYAEAAQRGAAASGEVQAQTEGLLVALDVAVGDRVSKGQTLAVVEAMKMQHRHVAGGDGVVTAIGATLETQVGKGQLLVALQLDPDPAADLTAGEEGGS